MPKTDYTQELHQIIFGEEPDLSLKNPHFTELLHHRYKNRQNSKNSTLPTQFLKLSEKQKQKQAQSFIKKAQKKLKGGSLEALEDFNFATLLEPKNAHHWHRKALAYLEFALDTKRNEFFPLALKSLDRALELNPDAFHYLWNKANVLYEIGLSTANEQFFLLARENISKAIEKAEGQPKNTFAELYWDQGLIWTKISEISGEAVDVRKAIQAFRLSFVHQTKVTAAFWLDFGHAYQKMGFLINDNATLLQAIDFFEKALQHTPQFFDAWLALAECYSYLYSNTLNKKYFDQAEYYFRQCEEMSPNDRELLQKWAKLILDYGHKNISPEKLEQSIVLYEIILKKSSKNDLAKEELVEALCHLGVMKNQLDLILKAEKIITEELHRSPYQLLSSAIHQMALATYFDDLKYVEKAKELLNQYILVEPSCLKAQFLLAKNDQKLAMHYGDFDLLEKSLALLKKLLEQKPSFAPIIYEYGVCLFEAFELFSDVKYLEEAKLQFETLLENQPDALLYQPHWLTAYAKTLCKQAKIIDDPQKIFKAIEIFTNVLLMNPDFPKIHFNLALAYARLSESFQKYQEFGQAWKFFELAYRQNPEDDEVLMEWGFSYLNFAHRESIQEHEYFSLAEEKLFAAAKLGNEKSFYYLACLYAITGQAIKAFEWLEKAEKNKILPQLEDLLEEEWLLSLHGYPQFQQICTQVQKKEP